MDDWSKQWFDVFNEALHTWTQNLTQDAERTFHEMTEQLAQASDAVVQATDDWADQVQQAFEPEIDRIVEEINRTLEPWEITVESQVDDVADNIDQMIGPILTTLLAGVDHWLEEVSAPINSTVDPILQNYPTCTGCRHYYGQAHGGNMLVCAMHPFGPEAEAGCPDHDNIWTHHRDRNE